MKAQITRNEDRVVVGIHEGSSLLRMFEWAIGFAKDATLGSLAVLWFLAKNEKTTKEIEIGDYTITLDGGD